MLRVARGLALLRDDDDDRDSRFGCSTGTSCFTLIYVHIISFYCYKLLYMRLSLLCDDIY